ncbi:MAG: GYD domain-containing protein [Deltaproteobacteria bacterium]|nr:GYD domain-containing protein [Deltaproteobacteria bacterium]
MPTYISLIRYTQKGMETIKDGANRVEAAKKAFKAFGGELKQFYLTMGQYDAIVISEGPDDETAAKLALAIGSLGNIRTETMRVFTEDEFRRIIAGLP